MKLAGILFILPLAFSWRRVAGSSIDGEDDQLMSSTQTTRSLQDVTPSFVPSVVPSLPPSLAPTQSTPIDTQLNVLIITCDQLRYDAIRFVQDRMPIYNNHLKIKTPNIDKLAAQSVNFKHAYAQSTPCVPSRGTLRSGCTVQRHGLQSNEIPEWPATKLEQKLNAVRTYDQMLASVGYQVESYGKFHLPPRWLYQDTNRTNRAITYTAHSLDFASPEFVIPKYPQVRYIRQVDASAKRDGLTKVFASGQLQYRITRWPYTPAMLDPSQNKPAYSGDAIGFDSLPASYSRSNYTGAEGIEAIRRLAKGNKPWCLTVSFDAPRK